MGKKYSYLSQRPRTEATFDDIRVLFKYHPWKTVLFVPVALLLLGVQNLLYFATIPFDFIHQKAKEL